jgi:hypothetical protein
MDEDDWPDFPDEIGEDDIEVDVCQHCGGYFAWTPTLRAAWEKHWQPGPNERQPQRCYRCIVNDAWIEQ